MNNECNTHHNECSCKYPQVPVEKHESTPQKFTLGEAWMLLKRIREQSENN